MTTINDTKRELAARNWHEPETGPVRRSGSVPTAAAAFNAAFCQRVAAARRAAGLTQLQVAEALGMPQRSYQHFETRSPVPVHLIVPFADLVGADVRELLTGE